MVGMSQDVHETLDVRLVPRHQGCWALVLRELRAHDNKQERRHMCLLASNGKVDQGLLKARESPCVPLILEHCDSLTK